MESKCPLKSAVVKRRKEVAGDIEPGDVFAGSWASDRLDTSGGPE